MGYHSADPGIFIVEFSLSGHEDVTMLLGSKPDLVLVDIRLP